MNLSELIQEPVASAPGRIALVIGDEPVSYGELGSYVAHAAAELLRRGVQPGDSIALLDDCSTLLVATLLGAAHIGAAAVPIHVELQVEELREVIGIAGCCAVGVAGERHAARLAQALGSDVLGSGELLVPDDRDSAPPVSRDYAASCVKILTSGTTGLPKPVCLSHATFTPRIIGFTHAFKPGKKHGVGLLCVPGVHIGGLGGLMVGLARGDTQVIMQRFRPGDWLQKVQRYGVNASFLVPTMMRRILDHSDFDGTDLSSLRSLTYGAAPAPTELVKEMIRRFPSTVAFSNVFGQTETSGAISVLGPDDHRLEADGELYKAGSVGRFFPGVEYRLVDPESGEQVPDGEIGELWTRSPYNATDGWNRTGDLVRLDADGYIFPGGRLSDTINRGGEKFGPIEIEQVLRMHPRVADVAAAGIPDEELGERVGVAIVTRGALDKPEVKSFCAEHLARFKVPEHIAFVDEIPHTNMWKVSRTAIAALIARGE
jgi:long-chain acyl-CoA synthetase